MTVKLSKAVYQAKKNSEAVKAMRQLADGIARGELDVEFVHLMRGIDEGNWHFRAHIKESEKYRKSNQLSEVSS